MIDARVWLRRAPAIAIVAVLYFAAGKLGLSLAFVNVSASAVWPPTGLAIAALLLFGVELWPAIFLGAFTVNVTTSGEALSAFGIACGNTLEAVVASVLVRRFAHGIDAFERPPDVLRFTFLAMLAPIVSATIGVLSLLVRGLAQAADTPSIWFTWWLGDVSGALLLTPAIVLWARDRTLPRARAAEAALLFCATVATGVLVFGGVSPLSRERYPIAFLTFPVLVWSAFRFGPRESASVAVIIAAVAAWGTLNGVGPFSIGAPNESLLVLQSFMAVAAVTSFTLGAAVADRRRAEAHALALEHQSRLVAEDAARIREEFLSVATHELRTPVTSISGYAQLALRSMEAGRNDRLVPALEAIVRQSGRLASLITRLLDAAHAHDRELSIDPRPTDLSALTSSAVETGRLADDDRHRWELRIDRGLHAEVDPLRWEQLVMNLLDNAMKYSPAGRTITVRLRGDGDSPIRLEVADDGVGIPPERLPHIFDRFYRAHESRGLGGLGLGLYISREIAERHGGGIAVSSVEGEGTVFTVTVPGARASVAMPASLPEAQPAKGDAAGKRHVLVVDDEPDVRSLVEVILRDAGHRVTTAPNGEDALARALRERPDLILLDKLMPVMDGTAFARAYREADPNGAPIIAFCAARDAPEWSRSIGAVAYVAKPFDVNELEKIVRRELAPQRIAQPQR